MMVNPASLYLTRLERVRQRQGGELAGDFLSAHSEQALSERLLSFVPQVDDSVLPDAERRLLLAGVRTNVLYTSLGQHFYDIDQKTMQAVTTKDDWPQQIAEQHYSHIASSHMLDWLTPEAVLPPLIEKLEPNGHLVFSFFGSKTALQLQECLQAVDTCPHFNAFYDLAQIGDYAAGQGLANVVVESEVVNLQYTSVEKCLADARELDGSNVHPERRNGLTPKGVRQAVHDTLQSCIEQEGELNIEVELCFGMGLKKDASSVKVGIPIV